MPTSLLLGWPRRLDLRSGQRAIVLSLTHWYLRFPWNTDSVFATNVITARSNIWRRGVFKLRFWSGAALVIMESDITKHWHYVFCFHTGLGMSEQHLSYCTDDFLTGTLPQTSDPSFETGHTEIAGPLCAASQTLCEPKLQCQSVLKTVLWEQGAPLMYLDYVLRIVGP